MNGQIYAAWDLNRTATDEKIARTRAAIIARTGLFIRWDENGNAYVLNEQTVGFMDILMSMKTTDLGHVACCPFLPAGSLVVA